MTDISFFESLGSGGGSYVFNTRQVAIKNRCSRHFSITNAGRWGIGHMAAVIGISSAALVALMAHGCINTHRLNDYISKLEKQNTEYRGTIDKMGKNNKEIGAQLNAPSEKKSSILAKILKLGAIGTLTGGVAYGGKKLVDFADPYPNAQK